MTLVHVIPELRAVHVERYLEWAPDDVLFYHKIKWDMGTQPIPAQARRFTLFAFLKELRRSSTRRVELPEPLWVRELPRTAAMTLLARIFSRRTDLFAYCIENNDIRDLVGAGHRYRGRALTLIFKLAVGMLVFRNLRGVVFGSPGAAHAYASLPLGRDVSRTTILELPPRASTQVTEGAADALFVGRLEARKGVTLLMDAWDLIEHTTEANITIVGSGPLLRTVKEWAALRPSRRSVVEQVPHSQMERLFLSHRVLVAPSIRSGRWREQIGLPIKEALSYGLTVVTSAETGLAEWLAAQGHTVLPDLDVDVLGDGVRSALSEPLDPGEVASSLPNTDGRFDADVWMRTHE